MIKIFPRNWSNQLSDLYPHSAHVRDFALHQADDTAVWRFAIQNAYIIVSKDSDFHQLAFANGPPPKFVWGQRGNYATQEICSLLQASFFEIESFAQNDVAAFLVIPS